jgi:hypothetical protein
MMAANWPLLTARRTELTIHRNKAKPLTGRTTNNHQNRYE